MKRSRALPTIALAGLIAGILDITSAFVIAGIKGTGSIRMLQGIASGLLRQRSFEGGMATAGLGLVVPLAFPTARHSMSRDVTAVIIHIVLIGLPISLVVRRF